MTGTYISVFAILLTVTAMAFWVRAFQRVAIPRNRIGYLTAFITAAVLGIVALFEGPGWIGGILAVLSILFATFFTITQVFGGELAGADAIRIGSMIPAFTTIDEHGETFDSRSLAGNPVLIKFYRGHW